MERKDYEAAYRASHTLKGICSNLGFSKLGSMSANLADALKENKIEQAEAIFPEIEGIYSNMISVLTEFKRLYKERWDLNWEKEKQPVRLF